MDMSPLAPKTYAVLKPLDGVNIAVAEAGIKYQGRTDLMLMLFDEPAVVAGVFTTSRCASAPVDWCRKVLTQSGATTRGFVVNSGNANAFTGQKGALAAEMTAHAAAKAIGCEEKDILLASTGVIGEPLDASRFASLLNGMAMQAVGDGWHDAALAIMTTDTYPKLASAQVEIDGQTVTINGIAKGSGMIAPDMATMLSFIVTDAVIDQPVLQSLLSDITPTTFNSVTVDSDTSTSDTVLLAATGKAGNGAIKTVDQPSALVLREGLNQVMHELALQIVRDGEGATKEVEIHVCGAESDLSARRIALSIANSPLVKTAIAGEDANWGRVVMAVGKAGEPADRDLLTISFGDVRVAVAGERDPDYSEQAASDVMKCDEIKLGVDIGLGDGEARVWTCDLTKQYVAINGDYRS